jgi:transposase
MSEVIARCPRAIRGADPYHMVVSATAALDEQRRATWNAACSVARWPPAAASARPG